MMETYPMLSTCLPHLHMAIMTDLTTWFLVCNSAILSQSMTTILTLSKMSRILSMIITTLKAYATWQTRPLSWQRSTTHKMRLPSLRRKNTGDRISNKESRIINLRTTSLQHLVSRAHKPPQPAGEPTAM